MKLSRYTQALQDLDTVVVFSDFVDDQSDLFFVDTLTDSGTAAVGDTVNGVMLLTPSDGTVADNDEAYLTSANELFKWGTNREIYGRAKLSWTETTANIPNIGAGFMNAAVANSLLDDGGGPKLTGDAAVVFKVDGGAVWKFATATNGTSTTSTSTKAAVEDTDYVIEIIAKDWDSVSMQVVAKVNGEYLKDSNGLVIRHTVAIASATEMNLFAGIKLGAITNNDTLSIDYLYGSQTRV